MTERTTFANVLKNVAASPPSRPRERAFANPLATAAPPLLSSDAGGAGSGTAWDHAFAWAPDFLAPEDREPEPAPPPPRDDPESIAAELGLAGVSTAAELDRARREFMWRNHPDRRPDLPAGLATRRVAIANMLIDRARLEVSKRARRG
jgi:hypothetical protein